MKNTITCKISIPKSKEEVATAIIKQLENLFETAELEDLTKLQKSLEPKVISPAKRELAKKIAGSDWVEPNLGRLLELQIANLQRIYERRRKLLADSITSTTVAEILGYENRSTVRDRKVAGKILGIREKGVYKYPIWQFDPEGENGIVDGFPEVLAALNVCDFTKLNWLNKSLKAFKDRTPIEILKNGGKEDIEDLIVEARGVAVAQ